ncbi:hypothetical protein [Singulisphaera sp. PoT]|uniref:hypothetical protein n=1 Tax=Singulisphaera sp. PoT TaxID=3411797 RepID=UPI003BF5E23E
MPKEWRSVPESTWAVPGTPLAAWSGPHGSSLVVYRSLPMPGGDAAMFSEALYHRLVGLPGMNIVSRTIERLGSVEAARLEAVAPGTGDALAPTGIGVATAPKGQELQATRRIVIGFPRPADTLVMVWHLPETAYGDLREEIQATLKGLHVDVPQAKVSSY